MVTRRAACVASLVTLSLLIPAAAAGAYPTAGYAIWRIAGDGFPCTAGACDNAVATNGRFAEPYAVVVDSHGNAFVADWSAHRVRRITPAGVLTTVAGTGTACADSTTACGDGPDATAAQLKYPSGLAVDSNDAIYIADTGDMKIRKLTPDGAITTVVGTGVQCSSPGNACGDGGDPLSANLNSPQGIAVDAQGNLYISDTADSRVRKVVGNLIFALAGSGVICPVSTSSCGDGVNPLTAQFYFPWGIAVTPDGSVTYVSDQGDNKIRKLTGGVVSTPVGTGSPCSGATTPCGDGLDGTQATLSSQANIALDDDGNLLIGDTFDYKVRELRPDGSVVTVAGNGSICSVGSPCGDGGAATSAKLGLPYGVATDRAGGVLIADTDAKVVRWLTGPQAGPSGSSGANGTNGTNGTGGTNGADGAPGTNGQNGAQGPAGRNGRDAKVSCKLVKVKKKQKVICSVKLVNARVLRARLSRGTAVYARSSGRRVAMRTLRPVRSGHYTLTLLVRAHGKQARIVRRVAF